MKISFSFGSHITSELSEWLLPTHSRSTRVPPRVSVLPASSTIMSGSTTFGFASAASRRWALRCATKVAPASLNGLPPAMWS